MFTSYQKVLGQIPPVARSLIFGLPVIALVSLVSLAWMLEHRLEGYGFRLGSYSTAYIPHDIPKISGFSKEGGILVLELNADNPDNWIIESQNSSNDSNPSTIHLSHGFAIEPGINHYRLINETERQYRPLLFSTISSDDDQDVTFSSSDLLFGNSKRFSIEELTANISDFPADHVAQVNIILEDLNIQPDDPTLIKLEKLWKFIDTQLEIVRNPLSESRSDKTTYIQQDTKPKLDARKPAFVQYQRALSGDVKLDCANYAEIFLLFATIADIRTRIVDIIRESDGVNLAAHTFNEVYLEEDQRWAYVDLDFRVLSVRSGSDGLPVNAVELVKFHQAKAYDGLVAVVRQDNELVTMPYQEASEFIRLYLTPNATFVFHRIYDDRFSLQNLLRRYLLDPDPAYALHGSLISIKHALLRISFYGVVIAPVLWLALLVYWLWKFRMPG